MSSSGLAVTKLLADSLSYTDSPLQVGNALREAIASRNPSKYQTLKVKRKKNRLRRMQGKRSSTSAIEMTLLEGSLTDDDAFESSNKSSSDFEPLPFDVSKDIFCNNSI